MNKARIMFRLVEVENLAALKPQMIEAFGQVEGVKAWLACDDCAKRGAVWIEVLFEPSGKPKVVASF